MNREKKKCAECDSEYYADSSKMSELCPECAHRLYNYPNCKHEFINGECVKCGWKGNSSEYLKNESQ